VTRILKVFFQNQWRKKTEEELDKRGSSGKRPIKMGEGALWMKAELEIKS